ncbi:hypothetical protein MMSR116_05870 [Methylobacterium mesophilicum SR1.6/6]|uniref:Uncharacterized protein n=1 Tax=Methylobacterium mesophilicum SR1.6/6 TaxID=908290 RepID=A0A6B9FUB8_9HYPH|nr:hypothetical protein MMSR116_05870 [Methylobacterium mesophilicum SR1.6/6]
MKLDGKFDAESDDKAQFQFEVGYRPAECIVRAAIGDKIVEAVVGQCGGVCKLDARSVKASPRGRRKGLMLTDAQAPPTTGALVAPLPAAEVKPIRNAPFPPGRPDPASLVVVRAEPPPAAQSSMPRATPAVRPSRERAPQEEPNDLPDGDTSGSDLPED